jgi:hydrogenase maturation protease
MSKPAVHTLIIGIGNEFRRDDAVGLVVAARLRAQVSDGFMVIEHRGEGASLMEAWKDTNRVMIIDAVRSGAAAGTLYRFDAGERSVPANFFNYSTHAFSLAEAIEMARVLNQLPERLVVYGIEGEDFTLGTGLTPAVEQAAREVELQILADIRSAGAVKNF